MYSSHKTVDTNNIYDTRWSGLQSTWAVVSPFKESHRRASCLPSFPPLVVLTPGSFVGIFTTLFWPMEAHFRKYTPRQSWPMSDANVLTWLVLPHVGSFHQLINHYGPEQTVWREKETKMAEKCLFFCASYPDQKKQTTDVKAPASGPESDCLVDTSGLELPLNQPKWSTG